MKKVYKTPIACSFSVFSSKKRFRVRTIRKYCIADENHTKIYLKRLLLKFVCFFLRLRNKNNVLKLLCICVHVLKSYLNREKEIKQNFARNISSAIKSLENSIPIYAST